MEVVDSNPREVDSSSQLEKFVRKNGKLLKVVGHEMILICMVSSFCHGRQKTEFHFASHNCREELTVIFLLMSYPDWIYTSMVSPPDVLYLHIA